MKKFNFFHKLSRPHNFIACSWRSYSTSSTPNNNNNEIYVWGSIGDEKIPKPTKLFTNTSSKSYFGGEKIVDICCGSEHVIFLSNVGNLYALGNNQYGQCGHNPNRIPFAAEPTKIELSHPIKQIYSLRDSTLALANDERTLYSFGLDDSSQLGLGFNRTGFVHTPRIVEMKLEIEKIHDLYCGSRHTFMKCTTRDGMQKLFCWGQNQFSQLQLGHMFNQNEITEAILPKNVNGSDVLGMSCGISHSILYTKDNVYSVGRGNEGQLGFISKYSPEWQIVPMPNHHMRSDTIPIIEKISSGMAHSIALLNYSGKQELVGWGSHIFSSPTPTPQLINHMATSGNSENRITLLESGFNHTFIRVGSEHLYAIGCGSSYQLGQGSKSNAEGKFVSVLHPNVSNIRKIASGFSLSVSIGI
ncbi:hypothetical protein C9374_006883 [Naegleria lovaniensis]|uniref:Uncharacterized protein n=1 Tax=Naegleria lovaniensis TaxID=51637 RepID=A0AA88KRL4_NAELO|nr:uncharacterized protein C9374_006883 [Naegleria lovaniensis]KAG2393352.1 hypothetical protein C9374_006883 [Naegleria lovaniensis]